MQCGMSIRILSGLNRFPIPLTSWLFISMKDCSIFILGILKRPPTITTDGDGRRPFENTEDKDRAVFHRDKQPACQGDGETVQAGEDSYTHAALHSVYGLQDKGDTECKKLCWVRQV